MPQNVSDEALARVLNQMGIVTLDQIEEAKASQAESAKKGVLLPLADVLIQQGRITASIRENVEKKVQAQQVGGFQVLGQYRLLRKLGEGGMGAVFLAEDTVAQRQVALKVLPKKHASDPDFLARFRREAQAAGALNHLNIVSAYTIGEDRGYHFIAMEYCDGEPLDRILKRDGLLPLDKALEVIVQVAQGLKHAHDHGFIHRDIKPANIVLCAPFRSTGVPPGTPQNTGETPVLQAAFVAKILDLGLSKNVAAGEQSFVTQMSTALGTPHYISPEQAKGEKSIDGRTDIYSLGATFYHLVTGQTPFQGSTAAVIMTKHLNEQLVNPQDIVPDLPDGVAHVIMRMMAKAPADRYADCKELLDDLGLVVGGKMPDSLALEPSKSSVAMRQELAEPGQSRDREGAVSPLAHARGSEATARGTYQHKLAGGKRAATAAHPAMTYVGIGGGVVALGIILFLVMGGKTAKDKPETRNPTSETVGKDEPDKGSAGETATAKTEVKTPPKTTAARPPERPKPEVKPPPAQPTVAARPALQPENTDLKPETAVDEPERSKDAMAKQDAETTQAEAKLAYEQVLAEVYGILNKNDVKAAVAKLEQAKADPKLVALKAALDRDIECAGYVEQTHKAVAAGAALLADGRAFTLRKSNGKEMAVAKGTMNAVSGVKDDAIVIDQEFAGGKATTKLKLSDLAPRTRYELACLGMPPGPEGELKLAFVELLMLQSGAEGAKAETVRSRLEAARKANARAEQVDHLAGRLEAAGKKQPAQPAAQTPASAVTPNQPIIPQPAASTATPVASTKPVTFVARASEASTKSGFVVAKDKFYRITVTGSWTDSGGKKAGLIASIGDTKTEFGIGATRLVPMRGFRAAFRRVGDTDDVETTVFRSPNNGELVFRTTDERQDSPKRQGALQINVAEMPNFKWPRSPNATVFAFIPVGGPVATGPGGVQRWAAATSDLTFTKEGIRIEQKDGPEIIPPLRVQGVSIWPEAGFIPVENLADLLKVNLKVKAKSGSGRATILSSVLGEKFVVRLEATSGGCSLEFEIGP